MAAHEDHGHGADHAAHPHPNYFAIFIVLCVCTGLSWLIDEGRGALTKTVLASLVLGVACVKALCVMMYFMHLKFEGPWKYVLLAPTTVLAMALPFALAPDIGFHYYMTHVPQETEAQYQDHLSTATHGAHGAAPHAPHDDGAAPQPHGEHGDQDAHPHGEHGAPDSAHPPKAH